MRADPEDVVECGQCGADDVEAVVILKWGWMEMTMAKHMKPFRVVQLCLYEWCSFTKWIISHLKERALLLLFCLTFITRKYSIISDW